MCSSVKPERVVRTLHNLFASYDDALEELGILKVDTVGMLLYNTCEHMRDGCRQPTVIMRAA